MRLWSLHPHYLDAKGLVAVWREGLLALAVLKSQTRGYRHHPQLLRFKHSRDPIGSLRAYLRGIYTEANRRGYAFDVRKISGKLSRTRLTVTRGQINYELRHLKRKLKQRDPEAYRRLRRIARPQAHPLFRVVAGEIEPWEII